MRFVPYEDLGDTPNVIVDGAAQRGTLLSLSHWPGSNTPAALARDVSAEIAFAWLDSGDRFAVDAEVVSNNHFDEDGLVSVFTLTNSTEALRLRSRLIDVASAGDFGTFSDREAARVSMAIAASSQREASNLDPSIFDLDYPAQAAALYEELLGRIGEWCERPESCRGLWEHGDAQLERGLEALRSGKVTIEEFAEVDLAVVQVPTSVGAIADLALYNATDCFRVLIVSEGRYELRYRYETWVRYQSKRPLPRLEWAQLAEGFSLLDEVRWVADPVDTIMPRLTHIGPSCLEPGTVVSLVTEHLRRAPIGFDPFG